MPNRDGEIEPGASHKASTAKGVDGVHLVDADGGGARVERVDPDSVVADGLHRDDVILEIDRLPVQGALDASRRLHRAPGPTTMLLRVKRDGSFLYVGVDLR
jgi:S1-C subfamily serine protease